MLLYSTSEALDLTLTKNFMMSLKLVGKKARDSLHEDIFTTVTWPLDWSSFGIVGEGSHSFDRSLRRHTFMSSEAASQV